MIVYPAPHVGNPNGGQGGDGTIARGVAHQYVAGWDWIQPIRDRNTGIWDKVIIEKTGAVNLKNPSYLRLTGASNNPIIYTKDYEFKIGKSITLREGKDITIFCAGAMVYECLEAAKILEIKKISAKVINMHTIKPIDKIAIEDSFNSRLIVSVEEHNIIGGLGSAIAEHKGSFENSPKQLFLGIRDTYSKGGTYKFLKHKHGLTAEKIVEDIVQKLNN